MSDSAVHGLETTLTLVSKGLSISFIPFASYQLGSNPWLLHAASVVVQHHRSRFFNIHSVRRARLSCKGV